MALKQSEERHQREMEEPERKFRYNMMTVKNMVDFFRKDRRGEEIPMAFNGMREGGRKY